MYAIRYTNTAYETDSNCIVIFYKAGLGDHVTIYFRGFNFRNWDMPPESLGIQFSTAGSKIGGTQNQQILFSPIPSVEDDAKDHMCQCGHTNTPSAGGYPTRQFTCGVIKPNCIGKVAPPDLLPVWTSHYSTVHCNLFLWPKRFRETCQFAVHWPRHLVRVAAVIIPVLMVLISR